VFVSSRVTEFFGVAIKKVTEWEAVNWVYVLLLGFSDVLL